MNVDFLFHTPASFRKLLYFSLQKAIGSNIYEAYREFLQWTKLTPIQVEELSDQRLFRLLQYSVKNSSYYRNLGISAPLSGTGLEWLQKFPVLRRSEVSSQFRCILGDKFQEEVADLNARSTKRYDWLIVKTGGTTGSPTTVLHDAVMRDSGRATRLFSQKMCGFPLGKRYFRLWGSEQDLLQQTEQLEKRLMRNLLGEIPMNCFRAHHHEMRNHADTILRYPTVHHLMAYVDSAGSLARFLREENISIKLKSVMACAGNVTTGLRQTIGEVFGAEVFDKYGSRECHDIACECTAHQGLHIYSPSVFVEVLDKANKPVPAGQSGRLVLTLLNSFSFPLIRYEIGDVGMLAPPAPCSCGLPFPKIQAVEGRLDDMLYTTDGTSLSSVFVRHFIGVTLNNGTLSEWQLEQTALDKLIFRYVSPETKNVSGTLLAIQSAFEKAFGKNITTNFCRVDSIPPSPTGKQRWVINRCKPPTGKN